MAKYYPLCSKEIKNAALEMREIQALDYVVSTKSTRRNTSKAKKPQEARETKLDAVKRLSTRRVLRAQTKGVDE